MQATQDIHAGCRLASGRAVQQQLRLSFGQKGAGLGDSSRCVSRLCRPRPSGLRCHSARARQRGVAAGLAATLLGSMRLLTPQSCGRWAAPRTRKGRRCAGRRCTAVGGAVDGGDGWYHREHCKPGTVQVVERPASAAGMHPRSPRQGTHLSPTMEAISTSIQWASRKGSSQRDCGHGGAGKAMGG